MSETYEFRREDNGEVVSVDFMTMMEASNGMLEVEPGIFAKRINRPSSRKTAGERGRTEIVSDALGFTEKQFDEMEAHRQRHGFTDIEFRRDPDVPQFFQVCCGSEKAKRRYMKSREFSDRNSRNGGGQPLSPKDLEDAKQLVSRK